MIAQVYFDNEPIVRIFEYRHQSGIADLYLEKKSAKSADEILHKFRLYRKTKWEKIDWGLEANVYFKNK